jgi:dipeptidyl aminopeptidase/acylaminoacyl peptidase
MWGKAIFINEETILCTTNNGRKFDSLATLSLKDQSFNYLEEDLWNTDYFQYHKESNHVVWTKNEEGYTNLYIANLINNSLENIQILDLPVKGLITAGDFRSFTNPLVFNPKGSVIAFNHQSDTTNSNIWAITDFQTSKPHLYQITKTQTGKIPLSLFKKSELTIIISFDKLEFGSFLFLPDSDSKAPCIIMIHGGPEGQSRPSFNPLIQYFLYLGYAVSIPNVRGSTGYGKTFITLDDVEKRLDSVKDIASLTNNLKNHPRIDSNKLVVYGGSYGGYMVLASLTEFPNLYTAGINIVGIANFETFLENTAPWRRKIREVEYGSLEKDREILKSISPINKVDHIQAPLLIIHGRNDERVPVSEAELISSKLKERNIHSELLIFDDEGHGIVKRKNKIIMFEKIFQFLNRCLSKI